MLLLSWTCDLSLSQYLVAAWHSDIWSHHHLDVLLQWTQCCLKWDFFKNVHGGTNKWPASEQQQVFKADSCNRSVFRLILTFVLCFLHSALEQVLRVTDTHPQTTSQVINLFTTKPLTSSDELFTNNISGTCMNHTGRATEQTMEHLEIL